MPAYSKKVVIDGRSAQEIYEKVAADIAEVLSRNSLGGFDISHDPGRREVTLKSKVITATLICCEGELRMDGKLSLMAAPFRSKIDEGVDRWVARAFS